MEMDAKFLGPFIPSLRDKRPALSVFRAAGQNPIQDLHVVISHGVILLKENQVQLKIYLRLSPQQPCYSVTQVKWRAFPWKHCLHCNPQFCHEIIQMILKGEQHLYTSQNASNYKRHKSCTFFCSTKIEATSLTFS